MQQINLYLPEFQPNREPVRSVQMLWGIVILIILLTIVSIFSAKENERRELALEQSRAQLEKLKTQLAELEQQRPNVNLADLDTQILNLGKELERRTQIFTIIANKNIGNNTGFSEHLKALGRQSLNTISLSAFSLQLGGNYTEFIGKTQSADQVPLYIQNLRTEPVFAQSAFGVLNIQPSKSSQGVFEFSVAKQKNEPNNEPVPLTAVQHLLQLNEDVRGAQ